MKKLLLSALIALVAGSAGTAFAEHRNTPLSDERRGPGDDGMPAEEVTGRVVDIDHIQGALTLQTKRGLLALHGPADALQNVRIGDLVRVRVALDEGVEVPLPLNAERE